MDDSNLPKLLFIGGPDVNTRIELMRLLAAQYHVQMAGSNPDLAGLFEKEGFGFHFYQLGQKANPFSYLVSLIELMSIIRKERPSIVHTFDTKPSILGRLAAKLNRVPVVVGTITGLGSLYIIHGDLLPWLIRPVYEFLQKILSSISDLTIFYTQDDASFFLTRKLVDQKKTAIVPGSGILLDRFSLENFPKDINEKTRAEIGIPAGHMVITMVARLVRSKGVLLFADLARNIRTRYPETHFLLIGPHDTESLDGLSSEEIGSICESVQWLGSQPQVEKYLAISDIFVLPAEREGIPRALMEAGAMSLPLIASDLSGCREVVIDGRNGFLIAPGNLEELEKAVVDLITHPEKRKRFGVESRIRAMQNFDLKKIAVILANIYRDLLLRKGVVG